MAKTMLNSAREFIQNGLYYAHGNLDEFISDYHSLDLRDWNLKYHKRYTEITLRAAWRRTYAQLRYSRGADIEIDQYYRVVLQKAYKNRKIGIKKYGNWNNVLSEFPPYHDLKTLELLEFPNEDNILREKAFIGEYVEIMNDIASVIELIRKNELNFELWAKLVANVFKSFQYRDNFLRLSDFYIAFDVCYENVLVSESGIMDKAVGNDIRYFRVSFSAGLSELLDKLEAFKTPSYSSQENSTVFIYYIRPLLQLIDSGKFTHQFGNRNGFYARYKQ